MRAFDRNPAPSLDERKAILLKLARLIEQNRLILVEAANCGFWCRAAFETEMSEVVGTISIIRYMRRRLRFWMAPRRRVGVECGIGRPRTVSSLGRWGLSVWSRRGTFRCTWR